MSKESEKEISRVCDSLKELLIEKNRKYGDSALEPSRIFSKASATEQILVRIDDKLNRIMKGSGLIGDDEDVIQDLMGYLVLLRISLDRQKEADDVKNYSFTITTPSSNGVIDLNSRRDNDENWMTDDNDCGWDPNSGPTC